MKGRKSKIKTLIGIKDWNKRQGRVGKRCSAGSVKEKEGKERQKM